MVLCSYCVEAGCHQGNQGKYGGQPFNEVNENVFIQYRAAVDNRKCDNGE